MKYTSMECSVACRVHQPFNYPSVTEHNGFI